MSVLTAPGNEVLAFFFFSSRRRHTRCSRDWSSDVCSSDLSVAGMVRTTRGAAIQESELPAVYAPPGRQTYKDYWAACHGSEGEGHGPVCPLSAKGSAGPHHSPEPPPGDLPGKVRSKPSALRIQNLST